MDEPKPEKKSTSRVKLEKELEKKSTSRVKLEKELEKLSLWDEKIGFLIEKMRELLSREGKPNMREFWEAKGVCIELFKGEINPIKRKALWEQYKELTGEAIRLKEILEEQSAFSIEQIDLALQALRKDHEAFEDMLSKAAPLLFPKRAHTVISNKDSYQKLQQEINLLSILTTRLSSLRKETLDTGMRVRDKNRLLKSISSLGDQLYPRRKELIEQVSDAFMTDVKGFVQKRFPEGVIALDSPLYIFREEIKGLQGLGKQLTLSSKAYSTCRKQLNTCWSALQEKQKAEHEELESKKELFKANFKALSEKVEEFGTFSKGNPKGAEVQSRAKTLFKEITETELLGDQTRSLREKLRKHEEGVLLAAKEKKKAAAEKEKGKLNNLEEMLHELRGKKISLAELKTTYKDLEREFESLKCSSMQLFTFERLFLEIRDRILDMSVDAEEGLDELLAEKISLCNQVKAEIETFKKEQSKSGLDFEKAIVYGELLEESKEHLKRMSLSLEALKERI